MEEYISIARMNMENVDRINEDFNQTTLLNTAKRNVSYTFPDILDYLQNEWARMEMERSEWEVERAEMQAKIAFLQSECKGQENLKTDLVRRIKMLEYALIQERNKNYRLKYPSEKTSILPVTSSLPTDGASLVDQVTSANATAATHWLEDPTHLKAYLVNAGLGDAMNQLRQARVRELIALTIPDIDGTLGVHSSDMNADPHAARHDATSEGLQSGPNSNHPEDKGSNFNATDTNYLSMLACHSLLDTSDPETDEALAEFELLVAQQGGDDRFLSPGTKTATSNPKSRDWDHIDDNELLTRFKERYRADRTKVTRSSHTPDRSANKITLSSSATTIDECGDTRVDEVDDAAIGLPLQEYDLKRPNSVFAADLKGKPSSLQGISGEDDEDMVATTSAVWFDFNATQHVNGRNKLSPGLSQHQTTRILSKPDLPSVSVNSATSSDTEVSVNAFHKPTPSSSPQVSEVLGLGDLGNLTVANETIGYSSSGLTQRRRSQDAFELDIAGAEGDSNYSNGVVTHSSLWTAKYTLRSHFDSIRAIEFHSTEPILVTASEDHTLKLWNLNKTVQAKKSTSLDVEPVYTFRGHDSPVLSMVTWSACPDLNVHLWYDSTVSDDSSSQSTSGLTIFSGDLSGELRMWHMPNVLQIDPYAAYDASVMGPKLAGHADAIWSLCVQPNGLLLSTSADGTACLWSPRSIVGSHASQKQSPMGVYHLTASMMAASRSISDFASIAPVPTTSAFLEQPTFCGSAQFATGFTSGHIAVFNVETSQLVTTLKCIDSADPSGQGDSVACLISHPLQPWIISGHDDCSIRIYDIKTGVCIHNMVAHLDTVTALTLSDSQGSHLLSASHDCSIRLWDMQQRTCLQEITSHRRKFAESVNAVTLHPSKHYLASAGADALAKVYV